MVREELEVQLLKSVLIIGPESTKAYFTFFLLSEEGTCFILKEFLSQMTPQSCSFLVLRGYKNLFKLTGGKKYATTIDTLTQREPDSMLAAMFSGRHTIIQDTETVLCISC